MKDTPPILCAFCNKKAKTYHIPKRINGMTFGYLPICGKPNCGEKHKIKDKP